jgi:hypothetical protein
VTHLLLFDRREDKFVLALHHDDIESLLGPSVSPTVQLDHAWVALQFVSQQSSENSAGKPRPDRS